MAGAVELLLPCGGQIRFTFNGLYKPEVVQHQHFHKVSLNEYRVRINVDCKPPRARGVANRTPFCVGWNSIQEDGGEQRPKNSEEHDDPFTVPDCRGPRTKRQEIRSATLPHSDIVRSTRGLNLKCRPSRASQRRRIVRGLLTSGKSTLWVGPGYKCLSEHCNAG